jgi:hypothetical protein
MNITGVLNKVLLELRGFSWLNITGNFFWSSRDFFLLNITGLSKRQCGSYMSSTVRKTSGNDLFLYFKSDSSWQERGFDMIITQYHTGKFFTIVIWIEIDCFYDLRSIFMYAYFDTILKNVYLCPGLLISKMFLPLKIIKPFNPFHDKYLW